MLESSDVCVADCRETEGAVDKRLYATARALKGNAAADCRLPPRARAANVVAGGGRILFGLMEKVIENKRREGIQVKTALCRGLAAARKEQSIHF